MPEYLLREGMQKFSLTNRHGEKKINISERSLNEVKNNGSSQTKFVILTSFFIKDTIVVI